MKKVYIWNDLPLIYENTNINLIEKKLFDLKEFINNNSECKLEILKFDITNNFQKEINNKENIVSIGKRPLKLIKKENYNIYSKRIIDNNGFAYDCEIIPDEKIYSLSKINIVEDIIVSGTTMKKTIEKLKENNSKQIINIYFLLGYRNVIEEIDKISNVNCYCFNVLEEISKKESTCIFLSDLLFEYLTNVTYLEHVKNSNIFGNATNYFITKTQEIKDMIK